VSSPEPLDTAPHKAPLRVLVVDDHAAARAGIVELLEAVEDMHPVGEASDGHEALRLALTTRPDVVLMDLAMPGMSGIEVTRRLVAEGHPARVLILSADSRPADIHAARDSGAAGYLLKSGRTSIIVWAIRVVSAGEPVWPTGTGSRS
jgi:DNA-binding NarL/FixJ family response regulator